MLKVPCTPINAAYVRHIIAPAEIVTSDDVFGMFLNVSLRDAENFFSTQDENKYIAITEYNSFVSYQPPKLLVSRGRVFLLDAAIYQFNVFVRRLLVANLTERVISGLLRNEKRDDIVATFLQELELDAQLDADTYDAILQNLKKYEYRLRLRRGVVIPRRETRYKAKKQRLHVNI